MRIRLQERNAVPDIPVRHTDIMEQAGPDKIADICIGIMPLLIQIERVFCHFHGVAGHIRSLVMNDPLTFPEPLRFENVFPLPFDHQIHPVSSPSLRKRFPGSYSSLLI
jgi:hypothetical protein